MVAKKVSPMDILYHRKPAEEEETNKGQNKESFITNSLDSSQIIVFWSSMAYSWGLNDFDILFACGIFSSCKDFSNFWHVIM